MDESLMPLLPDTRAPAPASRAASPRRQWLGVLWLLWAGMCMLTLLIIVACLPLYAALLQTICKSSICPDGQLTYVTAHELSTLGLSVGSYAAWRLVFSIIWMLVWFAVATLLAWRKRNEWYVLLVAYMCLLLGAISVTNTVAGSPSPWRWPAILVNFQGFFLLFLVVLLFPDGRFVPRWTRWVVAVFLLQSVCYNFFPAVTFQLTSWTPILGDLSWIGIVLSVVVAQVYRYRYVSDVVQRQQTKWVVFGFAVALLTNIGATLLSLLVPSLGQPGSFFYMAFGSDSSFILLLVPLSFGIAILRYRLWDIDILINRTLVYGTLFVCIFGMYTLFVGYVGFLFQVRNTLFVSLLATGLVAFLFQPLREQLQRGVNRLMYGERDEPYRVISRLGQRLEATLAPDAVLPTIVETVALALKLPYVAITLKQEGEMMMVAAYGAPKEHLTHLPLVYHSEQLGEITLAPRGPGESFTPADRALLEDLARQTGVAVHTVRLTTDLQCLTSELQASRTQLVTMREEERRRLRRDLHDGLGSALTSMTFQLDAASNVLERDPQVARTLLADLKRQTQASIADIRRLVYNLRPPILDEWGLVAALHEQVAQYQLNHVQVTVDAPESLPPLPAAVEVAAYRIALEALANVVRHAHASTCIIHLALRDDALLVEVRDNGAGLPEDYRAGVGVNAMRERAAELGGSCMVETMTTGGTRVSARLPRPKD